MKASQKTIKCQICGWEGESYEELKIRYVDRNNYEYSDEEVEDIVKIDKSFMDTVTEESVCPECGSDRIEAINEYLVHKNERNISALKRKVTQLENDLKILTEIINYDINNNRDKAVIYKHKYSTAKKRKKNKINRR